MSDGLGQDEFPGIGEEGLGKRHAVTRLEDLPHFYVPVYAATADRLPRASLIQKNATKMPFAGRLVFGSKAGNKPFKDG